MRIFGKEQYDTYSQLKCMDGEVMIQKYNVTEKEYKVLENLNRADKIARYAADLINDSDFVFLDAGAITEKMIHYICNTNIYYVTNGINHAARLTEMGCQVYIPGGRLKKSTKAVIGGEVIKSIQQYNFTKCFMEPDGIDIERGFTMSDISEAAVKEEVLNHSYNSFILADHTKFNIVCSASFADIKKATIITDQLKNIDYLKYTEIKETTRKN